MATDERLKGYADPDVLVTTDWLADHLHDSGLRVLECDEDVMLYEQGHMPGAIKIDWFTELNDSVRRDYLDRAHFEALLSRKGISNDDTLSFTATRTTGGRPTRSGCSSFSGTPRRRSWTAGAPNGSRKTARSAATAPTYPATTYKAKERNDKPIRAFRDDVRDLLDKEGRA